MQDDWERLWMLDQPDTPHGDKPGPEKSLPPAVSPERSPALARAAKTPPTRATRIAAQEAIYTSENLRLMQDDWERFWLLDQPDKMTPYRTHGAISCDPWAPDGKSSSSDQCKRVLDRLRQLGSTDEELDFCGDKYRFSCKISIGGNPQVAKPFSCFDTDPVKAETTVLKQVEDWQRGIQGDRAMQGVSGPGAHPGEASKAQDQPISTEPSAEPATGDDVPDVPAEWDRLKGKKVAVVFGRSFGPVFHNHGGALP